MRDYEELVKRLRESKNEQCYIGCFGNCGDCKIDAELEQAADAIEELSAIREEQKAQIITMAAEDKPRWIPVTERLPEMYDAGILKKIGIMQRSRKVIAAISDGKEWIVDNNAELRDGKWYSDTIRFLEAGKKQFKVTHWMPLPEPYKERRTDE